MLINCQSGITHESLSAYFQWGQENIIQLALCKYQNTVKNVLFVANQFSGFCGSTKWRIYESNEVYFHFQLHHNILISMNLGNPWLSLLWTIHENCDAQIQIISQ